MLVRFFWSARRVLRSSGLHVGDRLRPLTVPPEHLARRLINRGSPVPVSCLRRHACACSLAYSLQSDSYSPRRFRCFKNRIVHSQAHDVVTARQSDGLSYGHERAIDLLAWPGDVAIDIDWPVLDDGCGNLIGLDRHRVFASVRCSLPKDIRREHGLHLGCISAGGRPVTESVHSSGTRYRSIGAERERVAEFRDPGHGDLDRAPTCKTILGLCRRHRTQENDGKQECSRSARPAGGDAPRGRQVASLKADRTLSMGIPSSRHLRLSVRY